MTEDYDFSRNISIELRKIHHYTCAIHVQVFDRSHYGFPETFWPNNENCQIVSSVSWGWGWLQNIQKDYFQFLCIGMTINPPISKILLMVMKNQIINIQTRPLSPKLYDTYLNLDPDCLTSLISVDSVRLKNDSFEPYKIKIISLKKAMFSLVTFTVWLVCLLLHTIVHNTGNLCKWALLLNKT